MDLEPNAIAGQLGQSNNAIACQVDRLTESKSAFHILEQSTTPNYSLQTSFYESQFQNLRTTTYIVTTYYYCITLEKIQVTILCPR